MEHKVILCSGIKERLQQHHTTSHGLPVLAWLIGAKTAGETIILGTVGSSCKHVEAKHNVARLQADAETARSLLPVGLEIIGASASCSGGPSHQQCAEQLAKAVKTVSLKGSSSHQVLAVTGGGDDTSFWTATPPIAAVAVQKETPLTPSRIWLQNNMALLKLSTAVQLEVISSSTAKGFTEAVTAGFDNLWAQLCTETVQFVAQIPNSEDQVLLGSGISEMPCSSSGITVDQPAQLSIVNNSRAVTSAAPAMSYEPFRGGPLALQRSTLLLNLLWYVPKSEPLSSLPVIQLRVAIRQQLKSMQQQIVRQGAAVDLKALHFWPPGLGHHCTIIYVLPSLEDQDAAESKLEEQRRALHRRLLLPLDRPLLRTADALTFTDRNTGTSVLLNVHEGLGPSGVSGGELHTIWGNYSYFHYLQGKLDDSGWGCAYRSLQTIFSWFCHQHFTGKPIPSHKEVQQVLVDLGDKERSFVGSKQWIGAIELGYVLDTLLGVTCKLITVSSGADIDQKARDIAQHFDAQGTPIMIGGGVLAYTLLGIDYCPASGECAYLILDPHYAGADDLRKIQAGQWVAWKRSDARAAAGGDLFVRTAFYNLLCPQKPRAI